MKEWQELREMVLYRLDRINEALDELSDKQDEMLEKQAAQSERISVIEIKSGFFGTIGGFVGGFCSTLVEWIRQSIHQ